MTTKIHVPMAEPKAVKAGLLTPVNACTAHADANGNITTTEPQYIPFVSSFVKTEKTQAGGTRKDGTISIDYQNMLETALKAVKHLSADDWTDGMTEAFDKVYNLSAGKEINKFQDKVLAVSNAYNEMVYEGAQVNDEENIFSLSYHVAVMELSEAVASAVIRKIEQKTGSTYFIKMRDMVARECSKMEYRLTWKALQLTASEKKEVNRQKAKADRIIKVLQKKLHANEKALHDAQICISAITTTWKECTEEQAQKAKAETICIMLPKNAETVLHETVYAKAQHRKPAEGSAVRDIYDALCAESEAYAENIAVIQRQLSFAGMAKDEIIMPLQVNKKAHDAVKTDELTNTAGDIIAEAKQAIMQAIKDSAEGKGRGNTGTGYANLSELYEYREVNSQKDLKAWETVTEACFTKRTTTRIQNCFRKVRAYIYALNNPRFIVDSITRIMEAGTFKTEAEAFEYIVYHDMPACADFEGASWQDINKMYRFVQEMDIADNPVQMEVLEMKLYEGSSNNHISERRGTAVNATNKTVWALQKRALAVIKDHIKAGTATDAEYYCFNAYADFANTEDMKLMKPMVLDTQKFIDNCGNVRTKECRVIYRPYKLKNNKTVMYRVEGWHVLTEAEEQAKAEAEKAQAEQAKAEAKAKAEQAKQARKYRAGKAQRHASFIAWKNYFKAQQAQQAEAKAKAQQAEANKRYEQKRQSGYAQDERKSRFEAYKKAYKHEAQAEENMIGACTDIRKKADFGYLLECK